VQLLMYSYTLWPSFTHPFPFFVLHKIDLNHL